MSQYPNAPYSGGPTDPSAYGHQQQPQKKGLAIAALVLGILALLLSWTSFGGIILGLIAIVLGAIAMSGAKKGRSGGFGLALAGVITGVLGLLIGIAFLVVSLVFLDETQDLQDCLEGASDSSAEQQCQQQFRDDVTN